MSNIDDEVFIRSCGLTNERWDNLKEYQETLREIYADYLDFSSRIQKVAVSLAEFLQEMETVHSVRWRVKSPDHLIKKICRKIESGAEKYADISARNYRDRITDLIGLRILHLIKGDFTLLHKKICSTWNLAETPKVYVRQGDPQDLRELYKELGLDVVDHPDGYRSIHYVIFTNFTKEKIAAELQVRTVFEEGWSEIDHRIRYPEFSQDPVVSHFLAIFNRISGAADEMGSFIHKLSVHIDQLLQKSEQERIEAQQYSDALLQKFAEIEELSEKNVELKNKVQKLKELLNYQRITVPTNALASYAYSLHELRNAVENAAIAEAAGVKNIEVNALNRYGIDQENYRLAVEATKNNESLNALSLTSGVRKKED